ncbi:MAG: aromatic amino acid DMT transporter YddG [Thauera sp.]|nr:aromatic amino acid DMT transporter YddG [Thauera sp.]
MKHPSQNKATLIGLLAVLLWSAIVGLIREVSNHFGAVGGAALIYTAASALLLATLGWPRLSEFPRRYLLWGTLLFVSYELCLALSIGFAQTPRQAIEVGMVNYLWPTFTIAGAILFNQQRANLLIYPGFLLSMLGISWILGGDQGFDLPGMWHNVQANPLSYGLAFVGAVIWAAYCTVTARIANGKNAVTLFFILVAVVLWLQYLLTGAPPLQFSWAASGSLALAAIAMGMGYAAWNVGILHGKVTVLAGASYFIPVFSAALAALILRTALPFTFWQGALLVCAGSILCWLATRGGRSPAAAEVPGTAGS